MADPQIPIQLPLAFDLGATFVSGLAGALVAVRRQYDFVGVFALAFVTGLGGALVRDGIFLASGPPMAVRDSRYLLAVLSATLVALAIDQLNTPLARIVLVFDAVGLGVYAVVGADRSLAAGLGHLGAVLVGVVNAVGGGVLRDVLTREEPVLFKPGQFYATGAALGSALYVCIVRRTGDGPAAGGRIRGRAGDSRSPPRRALRLAHEAVVLGRLARTRRLGGIGLSDEPNPKAGRRGLIESSTSGVPW